MLLINRNNNTYSELILWINNDKHITEIKQQIAKERFINNNDNITPTAHKLTRKILKQADDWIEWEKAEHKQLDQYKQQNTFGPPCKLPPGANVLNLIWTYIYKVHEQLRNARCVCNGAKNHWGCVIIGETFSHQFISTSPHKNCQVSPILALFFKIGLRKYG